MKEQEKPKTKKSFKEWWKAHKPSKRRLIQLYAALLFNANLKGYFTGNILTAKSKQFCVPGLNCYSCPGAIGACPLGALQNALTATHTRAPYYMLGIIILFGVLLGRTICGFLCPIGLGQELLYKIKTPKLRKSRFTRVFSYLKYVILAVFVVAIPLLYSMSNGIVPGFCKYICPAGTFGGAVFLLLNPHNADKFAMLGPLFTWKFCLMVAIMVASVFIFRFFCRFLCPLGAIYGFFNKISVLGVRLDKNQCTDCGLCVSHCKMDVKHVGDHECINCGECMSVCPAHAISWKGSKLFVHKNAVEAEAAEPQRPLQGMLIEKSVKEEIAVSETTQNLPETSEPENGGKPQKPQKPKRDAKFILQVAAWSLAAVILAGALIYYNVQWDKNSSQNQPPSTVIPPDDDPGSDKPLGYKEGCRLYNFAVNTYAGKVNEDPKPFVLNEHRGEIVLINFWYTTCDPCVQEMPEINQVAEEYDIRVLAIHSAGITEPNGTEGVQAWLNSHWGDYSIIFGQDSGSGNGDSVVYNLFGGNGTYPMSLLVDKEGVVSKRWASKVSYEGLVSALEALNAEKR